MLDLTRVLAGPFCGMVLADLGVETIKIELPIKGDDARFYPPFVNGENAYFCGGTNRMLRVLEPGNE